MLKTLFFLVIVSLELFAAPLKDIYYVNSNDINISQIVPDAKKDVNLFSIEQDRYTKRVKSKKVVKLLKQYGYGSYEASSRYIKFIKKSPIDTTKMELALKKMYKRMYTDIKINRIDILPRGYISSLDKEYIVKIKPYYALHRDGVMHVETSDNKKIFFDYYIDAVVSVYLANKDIDRGDKLSLLNTTKRRVALDKFRALPMQERDLNVRQSKHNIKKNRIITERDIEELTMVKRGSKVNVKLDNKGILISFSAESLQNGKLNDIITVKNNKGKRFKVRVVGKNRVELK